jgi:hypothetical protein
MRGKFVNRLETVVSDETMRRFRAFKDRQEIPPKDAAVVRRAVEQFLDWSERVAEENDK